MKRIAVVGAGIAGLGAAYALQQTTHCDVTVFESSSRLGGRMQTHRQEGYAWDPAAQFILNKFRTILALMSELKVPLTGGGGNSTIALILPNNAKYYFRMNDPLSMFRHPKLSLHTKLRLLKFFFQTFLYREYLDFPWMEKVQKLDNLDNLRATGDRDYGADAVDYLLSLPTSNLFFWRPEVTPWWLPLFSLKLLVNSKMLIPHGGMGSVTSALAGELDVRTNHRVQKIVTTAENQASLVIHGPRGLGTLVFDRVVIATPAPFALAMLPHPEQALGALRAAIVRTALYTQVITVAVAYKLPPEQRAFGVFVPLKDSLGLSTIAWEHLKTRGQLVTNHGLGVLSTTNDYARQVWGRSDPDITDAMIDLAQNIYRNSKQSAHLLELNRYAHATPIMKPTRSRELYQARQAGPAPGSPVFLCGDYWLGPNVEQALITGYRAAQEVLESLNLPVPTKLMI